MIDVLEYQILDKGIRVTYLEGGRLSVITLTVNQLIDRLRALGWITAKSTEGDSINFGGHYADPIGPDEPSIWIPEEQMPLSEFVKECLGYSGLERLLSISKEGIRS